MKKIRFFTYLLVVFLAVIGLYQLNPPMSAGTNAPSIEFSSSRAIEHLKIIAQKPHPIGSPEQAKVRDYIVDRLTALELTPQIQTTTVLNPKWGTPIVAGTVRNIIAKLPGTDNTKAVSIVAHYDSVSNGPGASDDGVAVAAMLETIRALKASPPLPNDIVFLFSDGEEPGLLGAKAFIDEHPEAKKVGVVINFEARGNSGPSLMFETGTNNGRLIREFARAAPHPVASSLFYSIYKLLPNDTDFTIFKDAGLTGLNFSFIDGLIRYHTQSDNLANVSSRSLQHHGENMLALARRLGNTDLNQIQAPDAVYFNLISPIFIQYSETWVVPLSILVTLLFAGVVRVGFRQRQLTARGIAIGFGVLLASVASAAIAVTLAWWLITNIHTEYQSIPQADTYNSKFYLMGFVALSVAIASAWYSYTEQRTSIPNLMLGALCWWLILTLSTSLYLPGASYLFTWPLLFSLIGLGLLFSERVKKWGVAQRLPVLSLCAIPGMLLLLPAIYLIFIALAVSLSGVVAVLVVLFLGLLIPHLVSIGICHRWLLPRLALGLSLIAILAGSLTAGFDADRPKPNSIFYGLNADTGTAIWASADKEPDEWTSQFLSATPKKAKLTEYLPMVSRTFLQSQAPTTPLTAPNIEILSDEVRNGMRTLRWRITSPRQARILYLSANSDAEILATAVNGKTIDRPIEGWGLNYFALPAKGIELTLAVKPSSKFELKVADRSDGLPEIRGKAFKPRPNSMMSTAFGGGISDSTLVSKSYQIQPIVGSKIERST